MASSEGEDVYATLLLSDNYLPGALVLAHSLRDAGTTKKLAVLYTAETVSPEVIKELKAVYDYGISVNLIKNGKPANLYLMGRPDLHSAFTKVNLWKLTQFRKIVYVDADVLALRAPDELFDLPHPFSAAPDIGWPDIFNTGVMALTPNMGDYHALLAMAERGVSFDGADQGLLNMYFKDNFNRLSFTYNVTPSAHYQYLPAYRHFQSSINMVHFIGQGKPWLVGREAQKGDNLHSDMVGQWWSVYDKHYRQNSQASELLRFFVKGEFHPIGRTPMQSWDPQRQPPPSDSKPEAENLPHGHYTMSQNTAQFVPPPIFPWEMQKPVPTRVFWDDEPVPNSGVEEPTEAPPGELSGLPESHAPAEPSMTGSSVTVSKTPTVPKSKPIQTDIWTSFDRTNAWDDVPEIQRYAQKLESHQRHKNRLRLGKVAAGEKPSDKRGPRVTDFPSEHERPSLPVTPAPVRSKPKQWGTLGDGELPAAQGVPSQADWDPIAQLQKLAKQQSEPVKGAAATSIVQALRA